METVLVTGAAGGIGTRLRQLFPKIRLTDLRRPADLAPEEIVRRSRSRQPGRSRQGGRRRRGDRASRRILRRRIVGDDPARQYCRLLQPVRGGAPSLRRTGGIRLVESRGRLLSAPTTRRR